jgi:adenylate cyclase
LAAERVERRLAAILAADVTGYSRLIGADEEGTLARLRAIRRELIDPKIADHNGRIVKTTGDGMLVAFHSVVDALRCAAEVQAAMAERNAGLPPARRIEFRVGIHQGDIVVEEGDIFGDGVNIAARLEALAEPGGICVSARVQEDAQGRLDLAFEDLGEPELKNIARPVRVYRVVAPLTPSLSPQAGRGSRGRSPDQVRGAAAEGRQPSADAPLALPDKPSIAVLPFQNMSSDPEQEFLADGIAEDVITALSRYSSLVVIARNSCFTYKGRAVEIRQVGRELGVRYVLEGSLRKAGNRIRVTAQLVEAETGNHVWAERYDRDLADIFAVQDEITEAVTTAIAPAIAQAERQRAMRRPPDSLDAWAAYQRGLWHVGRFNAADNALAQTFFQRAIDLDSSFAAAYAGFARTCVEAATQFQTMSLADYLKAAEPMTRRALSLDPGDAEIRLCLSTFFVLRGDMGAGLAEAERALSITPNLSEAHSIKGLVLAMTGRSEEGITSLRAGMRLDPLNPMAPLRQSQLALAFYFAGDYEAAAEEAQRVTRAYPDYPSAYRYLAAALGQLGLREEAKAALERAIALSPAAFDMYVRNHPPWWRPEDHAHVVEGLHKAGWEG